AGLPHEDAWTSYLKDIDTAGEEPLKSPSLVQIAGTQPESFEQWYRTNVYEQRQNGYATITITLPLGDITATQLRKVADLARTYVKDTVRTTIEQNIVLRWVSGADVPAVYAELDSVGLAAPGAGTIVDIASCPGTDTCKLGIASSRGLSGELRTRIIARGMELDEAIRGLHIKISGCFNSCGQHHVADLGFYGVSRNKNGYTVPHFQVVLGGQWGENAGAYGLAIGAVPSKRIPETVDRITGRYIAERLEGESFQAFIKRIGKAECKKMIDDLSQVPPHDVDPSFYTDWADAREFTTGDLGVGECAGEVVSPFEFQSTACEREAFEAQLSLEAGDIDKASRLAYGAMLNGAAALLRSRMITAGSPDEIVALFRTHFYDTQLFFDPFTGGKFAHYFFHAHERAGEKRSAESVHRLIEETQLFIEACHSCYGKSLQQMVAV
ncbi:MAG TPA: hypothetical protein VFQ79_19200, partial [Bryobacteraceae bacterium]|nr:hypothetical protein [Bryobacteraceae bacterium]